MANPSKNYAHKLSFQVTEKEYKLLWDSVKKNKCKDLRELFGKEFIDKLKNG